MKTFFNDAVILGVLLVFTVSAGVPTERKNSESCKIFIY